MNVIEAAALIGCKPSLVYKLMRAGDLAYHRIGIRRGKIVIAEVDVRDYLASRYHAAGGQAEPAPRRGRKPAGVRVPDPVAVIEEWETKDHVG